MWSTLLGLALLIALNPALLGLILLIVSRKKPMQNLLAYWAGALSVNLPMFLVPLALLHMTPGFASFAEEFIDAEVTTDSPFRPVALATGIILLAIAAWMTVRHHARTREPVRVGGGASSEQDHDDAGAGSPPRGRLKTAVARVGAKAVELHGRLMDAWESGSWRISFVCGMLYLPTLSLVLLIDTTIVTSGTSIGEQVVAAIVFVVGFLAVLELTLLSYLVAPQRIEAVLRPLHEWARAHNRWILVTFLALAGVWQLARGVGAG